jgi:hypothetical protein
MTLASVRKNALGSAVSAAVLVDERARLANVVKKGSFS